MRTFIVLTLTATLLLAGAGCKRRERVRVQHTEEEAPQLATTIHVADPRSAAQLVSGFHDVEQNAWRWTAGKFAVMLRIPRGAAEKGAVLRLKFSVPEPVLAKLKTVSLGASIDGTTLTPETFTQPGEFTYEREVPAALMARDSAKIDFFLDKSLPPGSVDLRELGVIVSSVGLESK
jgi:hypothetical protein